MSGLKIGLVTSVNDESKQLSQLIEKDSAEIIYNILPSEINDDHVSASNIHVWLLNVDDDSWDDAVDHLLDESEIPVFFNEPGTLLKQAHPEFWCSNLLDRLFEITGLKKSDLETSSETDEPLNEPTVDAAGETTHSNVVDDTENLSASEDAEKLDQRLSDLTLSSVGLPSDIAAELVSELEDISPVLANEEPTDKNVAEPEESLEQSPSENKQDNKVELVEVFSPDDDAEIESGSEADGSAEPEIDTSLELEAETDIELVDFNLDESSDLDERAEPNESLVFDGSAEIGESLDLDESFELETTENDIEVEDADIDLAFDENNEFEQNLDDPVEPEIEIEIADFSENEPQEASELVASDQEISDQEELSLELEPLESEEERSAHSLEESNLQLTIDNNDDETELSLALDEPEEGDNLPASAPASKEELELDSLLDLEPLDSEDKIPEIKGRATYKIDGELEETENNEVEIEAEPIEEEEFSLSLEPIEGQIDDKPITGKANFLDESFLESDDPESSSITSSPEDRLVTESDTAVNENHEDLLPQESDDTNEIEPITTENVELSDLDSDDFDLDLSEFEASDSDTLEYESPELEILEPVSSKQESQDPEVQEPEIQEQEVQEQEVQEQESQEPEISELSETTDSDTTLSEVSIEEVESLSPDEVSQLANEAIENVSATAEEKAEAETHINHDVDIDESFEIPMLDETASGIEFDEEVASIEPEVSTKSPCWVIGASLGGPAAVKKFMHALPADIPASFIIAQHIDENFLPVLADILTSNSEFQVQVANGSNEMVPGKVLIAPLNGKTVFLQDGSMLVDRSQKWNGPYSPCINDVIESVSQAYGNIAGAIIFSGMGEDGLNGAKKMRANGGQVWAQSVESCANASMPESVINNDAVDFVGSPEALAEKLVEFLK